MTWIYLQHLKQASCLTLVYNFVLHDDHLQISDKSGMSVLRRWYVIQSIFEMVRPKSDSHVSSAINVPKRFKNLSGWNGFRFSHSLPLQHFSFREKTIYAIWMHFDGLFNACDSLQAMTNQPTSMINNQTITVTLSLQSSQRNGCGCALCAMQWEVLRGTL